MVKSIYLSYLRTGKPIKKIRIQEFEYGSNLCLKVGKTGNESCNLLRNIVAKRME